MLQWTAASGSLIRLLVGAACKRGRGSLLLAYGAVAVSGPSCGARSSLLSDRDSAVGGSTNAQANGGSTDSGRSVGGRNGSVSTASGASSSTPDAGLGAATAAGGSEVSNAGLGGAVSTAGRGVVLDTAIGGVASMGGRGVVSNTGVGGVVSTGGRSVAMLGGAGGSVSTGGSSEPTDAGLGAALSTGGRGDPLDAGFGGAGAIGGGSRDSDPTDAGLDASVPDASQACGSVGCPDDGDPCNGVERCDPSTQRCVLDAPPKCDNGVYCDGEESCEPKVGCVPGKPIACSGNHSACSELTRACGCMSPWFGTKCDFALQIFPHFGQIRHITPAGDLLWLSTTSGVVLFDPRGTPSDPSDDRYVDFTLADGVRGGDIFEVAIDRAGLKWIAGWGAEGGLSCLDDRGTPFDKTDDRWMNYPGTSKWMTGIAIDAADAKWLSPLGGSTPAWFDDHTTPFDPSDDVWKSLVELGSPAEGGTQRIVTHPSNGVWVGSWNRGLYGYDNINRAWATFTTSTSKIPEDRITAIALDFYRGVWMATGINSTVVEAHSLAYLDYHGTITDPSDDRWIGFPMTKTHDYIEALALDSNGVVWIGDSKVGLSRLDTGLTPFAPADDILSNVATGVGWVLAIAPRSEKELWFGGFNGFWHLNHRGTATTADDTLTPLMRDTGPVGPSVNAMARTLNGGRWFATSNGASYLADGGTPLDKRDDRWLNFDDSRPGRIELGEVESDRNGLVYFGSRESPPRIFTLDDARTPFDKRDDRWLERSLGALSYVSDMVMTPFGQLLVAGGAIRVPLVCIDDQGTPFDDSDDRTVEIVEPKLASSVSSVAVAATGGTWVGADTAGLLYWDDGGIPCSTSGTWTQVGAAATSGTAIVVVLTVPGGVWLTLSNGNVVYLDHNDTPSNPDDDRWAIFGAADGLPKATYSRQVRVDTNGVVWLSADGAVVRLDTRGTPLVKTDDVLETIPLPGVTAGYSAVTDLDRVSGGLWITYFGWSSAAFLATSSN